MELKELQHKVDAWINKYGVCYFNELTNMAILTEEVGEVARIISRKYGEQSMKETDNHDLGQELADVLFVVLCSCFVFFCYLFVFPLRFGSDPFPYPPPLPFWPFWFWSGGQKTCVCLYLFDVLIALGSYHLFFVSCPVYGGMHRAVYTQ